MGVEYAGGGFAGFELQRDQRTVQGCLEDAVAAVAGHPARIFCAGRTDAGVHATGQVVHFDTHSRRPDRAWIFGVNTHLPPDVSVRWVREMPLDFHARFSANGRAYRYFIYQRMARSALLEGRAMWRRSPLDVAAMNTAAQALLGQHDFSAFRAAGCQAKSPVKILEAITLTEGADGTITLDVAATAFLQHMVRTLVGTLVHIGAGERPVEWLAELLDGRDRRLAGPTAPACGLYFVRVRYPERFGLDTAGEESPGLLAAPGLA